MDLDVKARLLMGLNVTTHGITIKNYTIGEIFEDVGFTRYLQMSSVATRKVRDYIAEEYFYKFKDISIFDIFCMSEDTNNLFIDFLNFFTGYEWKFAYTEDFVEFYSKNEHGKNVHIDKKNIGDVFEVVKVMYCLDSSKRESDRDDIDDDIRDILRELEEEENKVNNASKNKITLLSIIDGISTKHHSINLLNIWDYKIYQVMHTYYLLNKIDNEDRIVSGVYAGTVDKEKINFEKIYWANEVSPN